MLISMLLLIALCNFWSTGNSRNLPQAPGYFNPNHINVVMYLQVSPPLLGGHIA